MTHKQSREPSYPTGNGLPRTFPIVAHIVFRNSPLPPLYLLVRLHSAIEYHGTTSTTGSFGDGMVDSHRHNIVFRESPLGPFKLGSTFLQVACPTFMSNSAQSSLKISKTLGLTANEAIIKAALGVKPKGYIFV